MKLCVELIGMWRVVLFGAECEKCREASIPKVGFYFLFAAFLCKFNFVFMLQWNTFLLMLSSASQLSQRVK